MAKEAAQPQDRSMEEILQSIKRIIAEEGVEEEAPAKPGKKAAAEEKPHKNGATDSGVLELTEVADEGEIESAPAFQESSFSMADAEESVASVRASASSSLLEAVDREEELPASPQEKEEFFAGHFADPFAVEESAASEPATPSKDVLDDIDSLLSNEAAGAAAKAFKALSSSAPVVRETHHSTGMPFRSGCTVEDLALEALRPMLKEWLDGNLPVIVERLVEREIKKISEN
jgi:cell pole-organizing protein PopZ